METPARLDWGADRYVPFIRTMALVGYDLTGAAFIMQVRDRKDGGTLRADLATVASASAEGVRLVYAGSDTVAAHVTAGRLTNAIYEAVNSATGAKYAAADIVAVSQIGIRINETTMEAMPLGDPAGSNELLYWDIQITPLGSTKDVYAYGNFAVRAGVTA